MLGQSSQRGREWGGARWVAHTCTHKLWLSHNTGEQGTHILQPHRLNVTYWGTYSSTGMYGHTHAGNSDINEELWHSHTHPRVLDSGEHFDNVTALRPNLSLKV